MTTHNDTGFEYTYSEGTETFDRFSAIVNHVEQSANEGTIYQNGIAVIHYERLANVMLIIPVR